MSSIHALVSDKQQSPKRSRVQAEPTPISDLDQAPTNQLTLSVAGSQESHVSYLSHPETESTDDDAVLDSDDDVVGGGVGLLAEVVQNDVVMETRASRVSHGSVSLIGRRRVMEDAITVAPPNLLCSHEFFAVYDGHGGPRVSTACHERLHLILADEIARDGVDWRTVMKASFNKMDDLVKGTVGGADALVEDGFDVVATETIGSTATVVMVGEEDIVVANCGDSRAVLFSGGAALTLSRDHKSDDPEERTRFESEQRDIKLDLPVTRAIGHHGHVMKHCLIPDPQVEVRHRTQWDKFLIIASHGLWDVVSNEDACALVKNCLDGRIRRSFEDDSVTSSGVAATTLAEFAIARGSKDNISLVVIEL